MVLTRKICLTIQSFLVDDHSFIPATLMLDSGVYCKEKLDAMLFWGLKSEDLATYHKSNITRLIVNK